MMAMAPASSSPMDDFMDILLLMASFSSSSSFRLLFLALLPLPNCFSSPWHLLLLLLMLF
jgi:hypothetical protein